LFVEDDLCMVSMISVSVARILFWNSDSELHFEGISLNVACSHFEVPESFGSFYFDNYQVLCYKVNEFFF
jgi:hypothetical protein